MWAAPDEAGASAGPPGAVSAGARKRAPAVEQISDHGPVPADGFIARDSVGTSASPSIAINAMRRTNCKRCLKKFTARVYGTVSRTHVDNGP